MRTRFYLIILFALCFANIKAQIGINTDSPNAMSSLDVVSGNTGILIPRLTDTQRDALTPSEAENSLLIYNKTENCYNFWNNSESEWKSLCGQDKAQFTIDYATAGAVAVMGVYVEEKILTSDNYLSVQVNVTKPGSYEIIGKTDNGYGFVTSGTFLFAGEFMIQVPAQGVPASAQEDEVQLTANGVAIDNSTNSVIVNVLRPSEIYEVNCESIEVNGVYKQGVALNSSNYIVVSVNTIELGDWALSTNIVDGISFSGSGTFASTGTHHLTLYGTGTPTSNTTKTFTLVHDGEDLENSSCIFDVSLVIARKRLLTIGSSKDSYGFNWSGTAASNKLITTGSNFGNSINSIVKSEGFDIIDGSNDPSKSELNSWLLGSNPVDIVVLGYSWEMAEDEAPIIVKYLERGGVALIFSEEEPNNKYFLKELFNNIAISVADINGGGAVYAFPMIDDEILNGPFGDIRGKYWGEDGTQTNYATGIPTNDIIVYSTDRDLTQSSGGTAGRVTAFRHKNLNLVWVGDGGFVSNKAGDPDDEKYPFVLDGNKRPTFKPNYGRDGGNLDVYNAVFVANAVAWAIKQAEFNGINTP